MNPPVGASFYPFYSTTSVHGLCLWQEGGDFIPGTTNDFGGSSKAEFGPLLVLPYPGGGNQPSFRFNNFRNVLSGNPCPARQLACIFRDHAWLGWGGGLVLF